MRTRIFTAVLFAAFGMSIAATSHLRAQDADGASGQDSGAASASGPVKENLVVRAVVAKLASKKSSRNSGHAEDRKALQAYYSAKVDEPIWLLPNGDFNSKAKSAARAFSKATNWGLGANDFAMPESAETNATPEALADLELSVSLLALKYARHARGGRIVEPAKQLSSYLDRTPQYLGVETVMDGLRDGSDATAYLTGLHPKHPQFEKLRKALLKLRSGVEREKKPEDVKLPTSGPLLKKGRAHKDVALLRARLSVPVREPETPNAAESDTDGDSRDGKPSEQALMFDQDVEDAVKAFQKDNDLYQDGLVGRSTRRTLNGSSGGALTEDTILANMEQWRWMPDDLGDMYVTVNIPEYMMRVVKDGKAVHEERAIVGKTNNQTPVFSDSMETVVVHPSWGVPNSIKVRELLPSLARGGASFRKQGLKLRKNGRVIDPRSVNWSYADIRTYDVYQPPGRSNVLGQVKFLFPNRHQVYMHDTPTKHLFEQTNRTYSHGCMRLRNPLRLAEIVLEHDKRWTEAQVRQLVESGPQNNNIKLDNNIPVHVTYFTAVVDDDGEVRRLKDVYGHEKRIKLALAGKFSQIARGRDHLAPVRNVRRYATQPMSAQEIFQSLFGGF